MSHFCDHRWACVSMTTMLAICSVNVLGVAEELPVVEQKLKAKIVGRKVGQPARGTLANPLEFLVYGSTADQGQQEIYRRLGVKVYELTTEYELSPDQQKKLKLAGELEAKQLFFETDQLARAYDAAKRPADREVALDAATTLYNRRLALFGPASFLAKVVTRTVTEEQQQRHAIVLKERVQLRHRSNVEGAIRDLERRVVLQIPQHEALVELLLNEIPLPEAVHEFDESLVKYQFSQLPQQKMQTIFDAEQWITVRELFEEFQQLKPLLVQHALLSDPASLSITTSGSAPAKDLK